MPAARPHTAPPARPRLPLAEAEGKAAELMALLAPACCRLEVVGSVRRGAETVKDIELLAIPRVTRTQTDLFGEAFAEHDRLHDECGRLRDAGVLAERLGKDGKGAWGRRFKRALYLAGQPTPVALDLFACDADNWGLIQLIRTGPAAFSKRLVTPRQYGGCLPFSYRVANGRLLVAGTPVPTPDEASVFAWLDLPFIAPEERV